MDPMHLTEELGFLAPDEIAPDDLDPFMPSGMTVRYPPTEPERWR